MLLLLIQGNYAKQPLIRLISKDKKVFVYVIARMNTRSKTVVQNSSLKIRKRSALLQQRKRTNKEL